MKKLILFISIVLLSFFCSKKDSIEEPSPGHTASIKAGDLNLIFLDNTGFGTHPPRHSGIIHMSHTADTSNFFRSKAVGLNFEFIFDGEKWWQPYEAYFEPRTSPLEVKKISGRKVELYQPPTKYHKLESWTNFKVTGDNYIDMDFKCIPRADTFDRGYIGMFWASYPAFSNSEGFYYIGIKRGETKRKWLEHKTPAHNTNSTVLYEKDTIELTFNEQFKPTLYNNFSENRYVYPFYYGRRGEMVYIIMFDKAGPFRFAHSPNSGAYDPTTTKPAWDFQYIIPDYEVNKEYSYKARVVYKPFIGVDDVIDEYENWAKIKIERPE